LSIREPLVRLALKKFAPGACRSRGDTEAYQISVSRFSVIFKVRLCAHHEPIIDWALNQHHADILLLIGWLSPRAAEWCRENSRFESVYRVPELSGNAQK